MKEISWKEKMHKQRQDEEKKHARKNRSVMPTTTKES